MTSRSPASHPLRRLMAYGSAYLRVAWLASFCSVANKLFDLAPPVPIGVAADVVTTMQNGALAALGYALRGLRWHCWLRVGV